LFQFIRKLQRRFLLSNEWLVTCGDASTSGFSWGDLNAAGAEEKQQHY
jgi:hypothetical protein